MGFFNPNIPVDTDLMLRSQFQIRANFQSIFAAFAKNHVRLNDAQQGMHNLLLFRTQSGDPTTGADQIALYTKLVSSVPQVFFRPQNNATPIQMTYQSLRTGLQSTNPDVYFPTQYSFMAGPFVIYAGIVNGATNGQTVTLLPATTLLYVGLTAQNQDFKIGNKSYIGNARTVPQNIVANAFDITFDTVSLPVTQNVYYIAIGK